MYEWYGLTEHTLGQHNNLSIARSLPRRGLNSALIQCLFYTYIVLKLSAYRFHSFRHSYSVRRHAPPQAAGSYMWTARRHALAYCRTRQWRNHACGRATSSCIPTIYLACLCAHTMLSKHKTTIVFRSSTLSVALVCDGKPWRWVIYWLECWLYVALSLSFGLDLFI